MIEILVILVIITCIVYVLWPRPVGHEARALRIQCVNNLKQTGLAYRIWEENHGDNYPMAVPATNDGSMEFLTGPNAFRTFQVMSNELSTPKVLFCPEETDNDRFPATNFTAFCNSNISFFVGIDAVERNPTMILSGDHNITNGTPIRNGLLQLTTNTLAGWTSKMHKKVGNILLADGSVQQVNIAGLQNLVANTDVETNWEQMPVLGP